MLDRQQTKFSKLNTFKPFKTEIGNLKYCCSRLKEYNYESDNFIFNLHFKNDVSIGSRLPSFPNNN